MRACVRARVRVPDGGINATFVRERARRVRLLGENELMVRRRFMTAYCHGGAVMRCLGIGILTLREPGKWGAQSRDRHEVSQSIGAESDIESESISSLD